MHEVIIEQVHNREGSNKKIQFKGVLNKVLVSGLILATATGMVTPAFAAQETIKDAVRNSAFEMTVQETVQGVIVEITNTLKSIEAQKKSGRVSEGELSTLATMIFSLETAKGSEVQSVSEILNKVETTIQGLSTDTTEVKVAIGYVRSVLGITHISVENRVATVNFKDVPSSHWAYTAIYEMGKKGLFAGKSTNADGSANFAPNDTMTRGEFVTVVVRALYNEELQAQSAVAGSPWWYASYVVAVDQGLLKESELDNGDLNKVMNRQEMAMVLSRAATAQGESFGTLIDESRIPDYSSIGTYYRNYVRQAYTKGMLAGTDTAGTFSPMGTLNRAQAATVLYRLVEPSTRSEVDTSPVQVTGQAQTWVEGQTHSIPKAGDTVIKADGTKVVLKVDEKSGVLGAGQGVDIYTGTVVNGTTFKVGMTSWDDHRVLRKCDKTGEVHSGAEWLEIYVAFKPTSSGSYDGEVRDNWYQWDSIVEEWLWIGPQKG